jgi:hypothetical protein
MVKDQMTLTRDSIRLGDYFALVSNREKVKPHPSLQLFFPVMEHHVPSFQLAQALLHRL